MTEYKVEMENYAASSVILSYLFSLLKVKSKLLLLWISLYILNQVGMNLSLYMGYR